MGSTISNCVKPDIDFITNHTDATAEPINAVFADIFQDDYSGRISKRQFSSLMDVCYPNLNFEKLKDHIFPLHDEDGDSMQIKFQELMFILYSLSNAGDEEKFSQIFHIFDQDQSGDISWKELVEMINRLYYLFSRSDNTIAITRKQVDLKRAKAKMQACNILQETDENNDEQISEKEFILAFTDSSDEHFCLRLPYNMVHTLVREWDVLL